jgi:choline dehydrogenase
LRDHYAPRTRWLVARKGVTFNDRARGLGMVRQATRYALFRTGFLASVGAPLRAFVRSREGLEAPDLLLGWVPMLTEPGPKGPRISKQSGFTCYAHPMRPESRGHIHIISADPHRPPVINFNFLSSPPDAELTVRAILIARAIMNAPAMAPLLVTEAAPGADRTNDDEIIDWVKRAAETTYHPVGTCKMGTDPMAVVDAELRVHGIAGLRVADASIMPTLTSGNTNAPSIMIGEKAADMVLKAA